MNTGKGRKVRRSAAQWREIISRFEASGRSCHAFCVAEGLSQKTLRRWQRKFSLSGEQVRAGEATGKGFVELADTPAISPAWDVEVDLGHGVVVRLRRASRC